MWACSRGSPSPGHSTLPSPDGRVGVRGIPHLSHGPHRTQVYHLLFGSSPALDAESDLPGGQEPWSSLGSSPLFRMEVREPVGGTEGMLPASGWGFLPGWLKKGPP